MKIAILPFYTSTKFPRPFVLPRLNDFGFNGDDNFGIVVIVAFNQNYPQLLDIRSCVCDR